MGACFEGDIEGCSGEGEEGLNECGAGLFGGEDESDAEGLFGAKGGDTLDAIMSSVAVFFDADSLGVRGDTDEASDIVEVEADIEVLGSGSTDVSEGEEIVAFLSDGGHGLHGYEMSLEHRAFGEDDAGCSGFFKFEFEVADLDAAIGVCGDLDATLGRAEITDGVLQSKPERDALSAHFDTNGRPTFGLETSAAKVDLVSVRRLCAAFVDLERETACGVGDFKGEGVIVEHIVAEGEAGLVLAGGTGFECAVGQDPIALDLEVTGDFFVRLLEDRLNLAALGEVEGLEALVVFAGDQQNGGESSALLECVPTLCSDGELGLFFPDFGGLIEFLEVGEVAQSGREGALKSAKFTRRQEGSSCEDPFEAEGRAESGGAVWCAPMEGGLCGAEVFEDDVCAWERCDGGKRTREVAFACVDDGKEAEHGLVEEGGLFVQRGVCRKAVLCGGLLEFRAQSEDFFGGRAQRIDEITDGVGGGCEDKVVVYVDESQSAQDSGELCLLLHGMSAVTRVRAMTTKTAVSSVFSTGVARGAGGTWWVCVGVEFAGFFFDEADASDSIDLVAFVVRGFEFECECACDGGKEFMDAGLVL